MEIYDFEVLGENESAVVARGVALADARAMWFRIGAIARRVKTPGRLIRVTNPAGKIVVLVGVATALRLCADMLGAMAPS